MNENRHTEEVKAALKLLDIPEISLEKEDAVIYHSEIAQKFMVEESYTFPMWANITSSKPQKSVQNADAWLSLGEVFAGEKIYLFFEKAEDANVFVLSDGKEISALLNECYFFTFYISNENQNFLLAGNEHEFVIAAGVLSEKLNDFYGNYQKQEVSTKPAENKENITPIVFVINNPKNTVKKL